MNTLPIPPCFLLLRLALQHQRPNLSFPLRSLMADIVPQLKHLLSAILALMALTHTELLHLHWLFQLPLVKLILAAYQSGPPQRFSLKATTAIHADFLAFGEPRLRS